MNPDDSNKLEQLRVKTSFHSANVFRKGDVLIKETGLWATSVHSLLEHLEQEGFSAAPKVIGTGFDEKGRETLSFIEGDFIDPGPWSLEASYEVGQMLRNLHTATASYQPPPDALWRNCFMRNLGKPSTFGHCDLASWNIVARNNLPYALIDWEYAGPVDPLVELAQACWLNAKLHDDKVAELEGLPNAEVRAKQLRAIIDGYELSANQRQGFVDKILDFVVLATANEADEANIMIDTPLDKIDEQVPWALAWRARSAAWIIKNRKTLQNALE